MSTKRCPRCGMFVKRLYSVPHGQDACDDCRPDRGNPDEVRPPGPPEIEHGTLRRGYRRGCRCELCVAANWNAQKRWRQGVRRRPIPARVHSTENGYSVYGCRCEDCKKVHAAGWQRLRVRRTRMRELAARGLPADYQGEL